jgi:acylphosphatase
MDPISALGAAAAVVQFIDFTSNVISESLEIKNSLHGTTVENAEIEVVAISVKELMQNLDESLREIGRKRKLSAIEENVQSVGIACQAVAEELQKAIREVKNPPLEIKIRGKSKAWDSFRQALKSVWTRSAIEGLERRLDRLRQQLITSLLLNVQ